MAVTLYKEFLSTLTNGTYQLEVAFKDGSLSAVGSADFLVRNEANSTVTPAPGTNPKTGDTASTLAWALLMLAALGGIGGLMINQKKSKKA